MNIHAIPNQTHLSRPHERAIVGFLRGEGPNYTLRVTERGAQTEIHYRYKHGGWVLLPAYDQKYYSEQYCRRGEKLDPNDPRVIYA